jgi:hypothetical protein
VPSWKYNRKVKVSRGVIFAQSSKKTSPLVTRAEPSYRVKPVPYYKIIQHVNSNDTQKKFSSRHFHHDEFKKGYQPRNNLVKGENGDLLADSHNILNTWKNHFSQLSNVHNFSDAKQIEVHASEPLVPGHRHLEVEIAIEKLKKYKSPSSHKIPAELNRAGDEIILSAIHKLSNSVWNKGRIV